MPYLTEDDYKGRFGAEELEQLLAADPLLTFARALSDAQSVVDGYLVAVPGRTFAVPVAAPVPPRLVELTADLVRYELHTKKATFEIRRRRDQAIEFLQDMVAGKAAIPELTPGAGAVLTLAGGMDVTTSARVFTADGLNGYVGR